jgi:hypothetical protein
MEANLGQAAQIFKQTGLIQIENNRITITSTGRQLEERLRSAIVCPAW